MHAQSHMLVLLCTIKNMVIEYESRLLGFKNIEAACNNWYGILSDVYTASPMHVEAA